MNPVLFEISNPSSYWRSDYVQVDLEKLDLPQDVAEEDLELQRVDGNQTYSVPFQIDHPLGHGKRMRVLVFPAPHTPPAGTDDYSRVSAEYKLQSCQRRQIAMPSDLWIGYYHGQAKAGEPADGFNRQRDPSRALNGVKLANGAIEIYFNLVGEPSAERNLKGAVTSVKSHDAFGDMLFPYDLGESSGVFWGQITQLTFFPMPWDRRWFYKHKLREKDYSYELVYSKSGPVRATAVFRLGPIAIPYVGDPVFKGTKEILCDFYRMLYLYPNNDIRGDSKPYYMEELFVLMREPGLSIPFRPYYASVVVPNEVPTELRRFEHIPDYFVIWKHFSEQYRGYGFASDAHVRGLELQRGTEILSTGLHNQKLFWRLPLSHHNRCVHYFWFHSARAANFDPFHAIGHEAWYEKIFKPLAPFNADLRFPSPIPDCEDDRAEVS